MTDFSEIFRFVISLLPALIFCMIFYWIIRLFGSWDFGGSKSRKSSLLWDGDDDDFDFEPSPKKHTIDEVLVSCERCGGPNKELDAYCGYCGAALYREKTVKVSPIKVG